MGLPHKVYIVRKLFITGDICITHSMPLSSIVKKLYSFKFDDAEKNTQKRNIVGLMGAPQGNYRPTPYSLERSLRADVKL